MDVENERKKYVEQKVVLKFGQEGSVIEFKDPDRESLETNTIIKEISFS